MGNDFNPDTFLRWYGTPLAEHLRRVLNGPARLSTKMDNSGILHLILDYNDQNKHEHQVLYIDPAKGYRLIGGINIRDVFGKPDRSHSDFLDINWKQYGTHWYIKDAQFAVYSGVHSAEDRSLLEPSDLKRSTKVTVTDFHPDVQVDNSEFTLDGLDIPIGLEIIDRISGLRYKYKMGNFTTTNDMLEALLSKAESVKLIKNEVGTENVKRIKPVMDKQPESEEETSISNEESTQDVLGDTINDPKKDRNILMTVTPVIGIIAVLIVGFKLLHERKAGDTSAWRLLTASSM